MRSAMDMTPRVPPTSDDIRSEFCVHCEAQPGAPCANFGAVALPGGQVVAPGEPVDEDQYLAVVEARIQQRWCFTMPVGCEFHAARVRAATARRLNAEDGEDSRTPIGELPARAGEACCQFHGLGGNKRHGCGSDAKPRTGPRPRAPTDEGETP